MMFGNRQGWTVSALLAAATLGLLLWIHRAGSVPPPTSFGRFSGELSTRIDPNPRSLTDAMRQPGDGGMLYRQAIAVYDSDPRPYEQFLAQTDPSLAADLPALRLLITATSYESADIFASEPHRILTYLAEASPLQSLRTLSRVSVRAALLCQSAGKTDDAQRYLQVVFAMGVHLYEEGVCYDELLLGSGLMGDAALGLARVARQAGDTARAQALERFNAARLEVYRTRVAPAFDRIYVLEPYAGDMAALLRDADDRVWRTEAALALGRCQYSGRTFGEQKGSRRILRKVAADPDADPAVRTAARMGLELSAEQHRNLFIDQLRAAKVASGPATRP